MDPSLSKYAGIMAKFSLIREEVVNIKGNWRLAASEKNTDKYRAHQNE